MNNYIHFKKQRELGEILSDTFAFLRSQFKPFIATYFKIVAPYLLIMLIAVGFYLYSFSSVLNIGSSSGSLVSGVTMLISGLVFLVAMILVYAVSQSTVLHYIKSYTELQGQTDFDKIRREVYDSLWSFIGLGIIVVLSIVVGFICCFLPGIYLAVPLSLSFSIMIFMNKSVGESFSYGFNLVKDEWWMTFATLLVVGIIVGVAGYAFSLPAQIYQIASMGIFSGEMDALDVNSGFVDPVYIILYMISTLAQMLLNTISIIAGAFIFFNLNEKKNFTGTFERIQNLGKTNEE
ncbi:hypothetical protein HZY62_09690 [Maribacter polysiphoniae]|uniref:Glycerophosphoryl diester phosphodiesterase family protein n=1 Tax=Maribacter polysiphoniae TaxID=429344 RepID=A0A316E1R3_9FLAO|nr:hypothetical protein [Maribacter polysiphoniae]MBD1260857.1 hypothetical protein [Maribacter polysiphoniae]PWK24005.1 hypothetical protein LX92_01591 [Maribacter polysiphoniae]